MELAIVPAEPPPDIEPALAEIAVRLADEGIPVRAIARCLKVASSELYDYLNEALVDGKIVELPKDDWPAGTPRAMRALYSGTVLENHEQLRSLCMRMFKVTRQQSAVLSLLLRRNEMTKAQIHTVLLENRPSGGGEVTTEKMVDVVVFHIRKKLKPHNITVETLWGTGYSIPHTSRARAIALLDHFNCQILPEAA